LGADNASFGAIMGKRGDAGPVVGAVARGAYTSGHSGRVGLRDTKPLRQSRQGAGGGIPEGAECDQQGGQEDVNPSIRFALDHPE